MKKCTVRETEIVVSAEIENLIANGPLGSLITTEASSRSDYNGDTDNV